jgi:hypothetical protein
MPSSYELPPGAVPPGATAATFAVLAGARTFRDVARATGCTVSTAYQRCEAARVRGLISWELDHSSTLHPQVRAAPRP